MWFIGMIVGAIIGAIGDTEGVLVGAVVGAIVGAMISSQRKTGGGERLKAVEDALAQLQQRVLALEGGISRTDLPAPGEAPAVKSGPPAEAPSSAVEPAGLPPPVSAAAAAYEVPDPQAAPGPAPAEVTAGASGLPAMDEPATPVSDRPSPPAPGKPWGFPQDIVSRWLFGGNTLV